MLINTRKRFFFLFYHFCDFILQQILCNLTSNSAIIYKLHSYLVYLQHDGIMTSSFVENFVAKRSLVYSIKYSIQHNVQRFAATTLGALHLYVKRITSLDKATVTYW